MSTSNALLINILLTVTAFRLFFEITLASSMHSSINFFFSNLAAASPYSAVDDFLFPLLILSCDSAPSSDSSLYIYNFID